MWVLALCMTGTAQGQSWDLAGSSMRDVSMAGAGAAGDLPGAAIPVDPASIAGIEGEVATLSWRGSFPSVDSSDGKQLVSEASHGMDMGVGVARPLSERTAVAMGFQWFLPVPHAVETLVAINRDDPQAPLLDDAADFTTINGSIAVKVSQLEVAIGVSIGMKILAETNIRLLSLSGDETKDGFDVTESVALDSTRDLHWSGAPLIGAHWRGDDWNAFVSWRGQTGFETTGDQTLKVVFPFIDIAPVRIPVTYLSAWSPGRLTVGGNVVLGPFEPEFALRYIVGSSFTDSQMRQPDKGFRDVLSPAFGVHYVPLEGIALRAGYGLVPTVIPPQLGQTQFADATHHVLGLGTSVTLQGAPRDGDATELAVSTQLQILPERSAGFSARGSWVTTTIGLQTHF